MREAIRGGKAISAAAATRAARDVSAGEVVRIRLCRENEHLFYHVMTLARDGRVAHVTVDGSSGKIAQVR